MMPAITTITETPPNAVTVPPTTSGTEEKKTITIILALQYYSECIYSCAYVRCVVRS
jgi:hypothetical protein